MESVYVTDAAKFVVEKHEGGIFIRNLEHCCSDVIPAVIVRKMYRLLDEEDADLGATFVRIASRVQKNYLAT